MAQIRHFACILLILAASHSLASAEPRHGIAMHGEPALAADFTHLPYANPDAPQGGELRMALTGSFDSLNPLIVKGSPAYGVRTYVLESLLGRNWDEPFSLYGLLAESIEVSDDRQTFTFRIRPEAKFSDGTPVRAKDVLFSFETIKAKGRPGQRAAYGKVTKVEAADPLTVTFAQEGGDRELPLIIGLMPILPADFWKDRPFEETTLEPVLGSGPYRIEEVKPGETIRYRRDRAYWGKALALNRGLWNFETLRFDYYRDANAAFEAFKAGLADVRTEGDPIRWGSAYDFPAARAGKIVLEKIEQRSPAPASGFAFNTRRALFADARVREALAMVFDFEWANANLFAGAYRRTYGYYSGSELSSRGIAASAGERAILGERAAELRPEFLDGSYEMPASDGTGRDRKLLRRAVSLLAEAGWTITDKGLADASGRQMSFTILVATRDQEKMALHFQRSLDQIGIATTVRLLDATQFASVRVSYDYDMIPATWFNSLSPGNEQVNYFGSPGREGQGSLNLPGIADPAVDRAIVAMLAAKSREEFVDAVRAEDRLLVSGFYIVPFYDAGGQWVARWNHIGRPEHQPLAGFEATSLWRNP